MKKHVREQLFREFVARLNKMTSPFEIIPKPLNPFSPWGMALRRMAKSDRWEFVVIETHDQNDSCRAVLGWNSSPNYPSNNRDLATAFEANLAQDEGYFMLGEVSRELPHWISLDFAMNQYEEQVETWKELFFQARRDGTAPPAAPVMPRTGRPTAEQLIDRVPAVIDLLCSAITEKGLPLIAANALK